MRFGSRALDLGLPSRMDDMLTTLVRLGVAAAMLAGTGIAALSAEESGGSVGKPISGAELAADASNGAATKADSGDAPAADGDALVDYATQAFQGDLDAILQRGFLRIGTVYDPLFFAYDGAEPYGVVADFAAALDKHLKETLGDAARDLTVVPMPMPRDRLLDALEEGRVEVVAANLTVTEDRAERVAFTDPFLTGVREVVVTGEALAEIETRDDLVETGLHQRLSSSYAEHLAAINETRTAAGQMPIPLVPVDERLQDHDLLELVAAGVVRAVPVDDHKANLWVEVFDGLVIHEDIALNEDGEVAWAVQKGRPKLLDALNGFVGTARKGTELGNILYRRYIESPERMANAIEAEPAERLRKVYGFIQKYAEAYDFEPLMIAAQGFQESGLDQEKRSPAGAVGIMQLLPSTARDENVGIPDIEDPERNVEAGIKYLRFLRDRYFADEDLSPEDRVFLSLAAYNAGPGNIRTARAKAAEMGLDPNIWFDNVEVATARVVSREPVVYVRNILKYYTTYRLFREIAETTPANP
ncbi:MAG: transglycosylase SLT domain-containing protein [Pseudomonadota bacterium]